MAAMLCLFLLVSLPENRFGRSLSSKKTRNCRLSHALCLIAPVLLAQ